MEDKLARFTLPVLRILVIRPIRELELLKKTSEVIEITELEWVFVLRNLKNLGFIEIFKEWHNTGSDDGPEYYIPYLKATEKCYNFVLDNL